MPSHCICNCDMCSWAQQGKSRIWLFYDDRQILTFFGALCVKALVRQWHNLLDPVTSRYLIVKKVLDLQNGFKYIVGGSQPRLYIYFFDGRGGWVVGVFLFNTHPFLTVHDLLRPEIYSPLAHWHQKLQRYAASKSSISLSNSLPLVLQYIIISVRNVCFLFKTAAV